MDTEHRSLDSFLPPEEMPRKVPIREDSLCINPAQRREGEKVSLQNLSMKGIIDTLPAFLSVFHDLNKE